MFTCARRTSHLKLLYIFFNTGMVVRILSVREHIKSCITKLAGGNELTHELTGLSDPPDPTAGAHRPRRRAPGCWLLWRPRAAGDLLSHPAARVSKSIFVRGPAASHNVTSLRAGLVLGWGPIRNRKF